MGSFIREVLVVELPEARESGLPMDVAESSRFEEGDFKAKLCEVSSLL